MTQQELEARVAVLEARIRVVEDIEEIKKLLATYEECLDSLQRLKERLAGGSSLR